MNEVTSAAWIAHFLANEPPRSKSLVMTIFGDAIAPHGGAVWLGSLIALLAPFGVSDRLLRTSVFRLAQEGWLGAQRNGRRSWYTITPDALPRFGRANERIYAPLGRHWDGNWTILLSAAGNIDQARRIALRKELLWEGYSMVAPGVFAHPASDAAILDEIIGRTGVAEQVFVCNAHDFPGVNARPLRALIDEGWDLSEVIAGYQHFNAHFEPLRARLQHEPALAPEQAFVIRTLLIHTFRRVQLHDPQLPVEFLPVSWPGAMAYELSRSLYRHVFASAEQHILACLRSEDEQAPEANASFLARFGGLL